MSQNNSAARQIKQANSTIDLQAYFRRIGYTGTPAVSLQTLQDIQRLHPRAIPFENFNPLLRVPIKLDVESLLQKLVNSRRGGYCFEHNLLLYHVLTELGFSVTRLAGRVLWNKPETQITALTHMLLLITLDENKYIVDGGFGTLTPTAPLLLESGLIQQTPNESYRLLEWEDGYMLQAYIQNEWKPLYRFNLQPQHFIDYKVANWYTSAHPDSHFTKGLTAALTAPGRRYTLSNNNFSIHEGQGETSKQEITDAALFRNLLDETFHIDLANLPDVDELLNRLVREN